MRMGLILMALALGACGSDDGAIGGSDDTDTTGEGAGDDDDDGETSAEAFLTGIHESYCDQYFACYGQTTIDDLGWATVEDCYADRPPTTGAADDCPGFDPSAGTACIDAVRALTCDEFDAYMQGDEVPECDDDVLCPG